MSKNETPLVLLPAPEGAGDRIAWYEVVAGVASRVIARATDGAEIARAEVTRTSERQGVVQLSAGEVTVQYGIELIGSGTDMTLRVESGGRSTSISAGRADYMTRGLDFDPQQARLISLWRDVPDPLATLADDLANSSPEESADWDIAPCGLTWLAVSVSAGACATGVLVSCAASLLGASTFVEHCL